jgi:hypothetical protein
MVAMSQANRIRQFTVDRYIAPAIAAGQDEITIRAGHAFRPRAVTEHTIASGPSTYFLNLIFPMKSLFPIGAPL